MAPPSFVTLGMFIIDDFEFLDESGQATGKEVAPQIGGGGTYAAIGARIWLEPELIGMVVDKGYDFPKEIDEQLKEYGQDMWLFREQLDRQTTRAVNSYKGELRGFRYSTPRIRITPNDLKKTPYAEAKTLHFVCSPKRALAIVSEIPSGWKPLTIYEPIPVSRSAQSEFQLMTGQDRCVPEELPALLEVLPSIHILSPNAEEALSLLSRRDAPTKELVEWAAEEFLALGAEKGWQGWVIIRSGSLGAYVRSRAHQGAWVEAYWTEKDVEKVVDVTGAGNSFLGGLGAGLELCNEDVFEATFYASVSASYVIEQQGLPKLSLGGAWNGQVPVERLSALKNRHNYGGK